MEMAKKPTVEKPSEITPEENPAEMPKIAEVTPESLLKGVAQPEANERTIAAMESDAKPETPASTSTGESAVDLSKPDKAGKMFDPSKNEPRFNRDGNWAGKPGRAKGGKNASKEKSPAVSVVGDETGSATPSVPQGDRFDLAAELYTRAGYSVVDGIFAANGEWLPENDGEHVALRGAVASYLRHKGTDDLPPGLAVTLAIATYGAKRIGKPNTATRLRLYFQWIRARWQTFRNGRAINSLPRAEIKTEEKTPLPPQNFNPT